MSNKASRCKNTKCIPHYGNKQIKADYQFNWPQKKKKNHCAKRQLHIMKELNKKLATENAIITQADKGKTIVILNSDEYSGKVPIFLAANNFSTLTKHPTDKLRKEKCNLIIDKRQIKFLTQKKTSPPFLKAQLKLHKIGIPIRPVINNRTALAYKLAKHLAKTINQKTSY